MTMTPALPISMIPGDSVIHRINPIAKLVWVIGYIVLAFSTQNILVLGLMALFAFLVAPIAGVVRPLLKAMIILIPIASSLLALQIIAPAVERPWTQVGSIGPLALYGDGLYYGFVLLGRIVASLIVALVVVMTTHPSDLFTSLAKLKMPYTLNFMLAMTLQLIPVFQREFGIIMSAQKSRGMKGTGFSAVLPSFVPVFVGAIERVQQLSISLESRGFGSNGFKTSYRRVKVRARDWIIGGIGAIVIAGLSAYSIYRGLWSLGGVIQFSPAFVTALFIISAVAFFGTIAVTIAYSFKK
ncbi:MAG TPA: energy-coupling factor transporter transmembrane component T [Pseudolysinimonas sp.]|jgi:energy-coupling factor transport system permease protein|nr:energy-coupling factor transporter transmembrane component T [Pseudolysinimonas sp.]